MCYSELNKYPISYNYCRICGHVPQTERDEPNHTCITFWDADDGWIIGTLCRYCWSEVKDDKPQPGDFAYDDSLDLSLETDEDPTPFL